MKMGTIYFTRHGQTIWNLENKICGATDIALTELGYRQAEALGRKILDEQLPIDEILYSPLIRAAETARAVSDITKIPAYEEPALTEQNFGRFESTPRDGEAFRLAKNNFIYDFDGGETMLHLAQRIYNLIDRLKRDPGRTRLLVAHNGIARMIHSYFHNMTNEEFAQYGIRNCEIVAYHF